MNITQQQLQSPVPPGPAILKQVGYVTYHELLCFHFSRLTTKRNGQPISEQVIRNQRSHFGKWMRLHELDENSPVGDELREHFTNVNQELE